MGGLDILLFVNKLSIFAESICLVEIDTRHSLLNAFHLLKAPSWTPIELINTLLDQLNQLASIRSFTFCSLRQQNLHSEVPRICQVRAANGGLVGKNLS